MKKIYFFSLMTLLIEGAYAQSFIEFKQLETKNGVTYWGGYPIYDVIKDAELIFEGRILSDSVYAQIPPGMTCTYHRVLVLKQFKGTFESDTIQVVTPGGMMLLNGSWEGNNAYAVKDDIAVIFASNKPRMGNVNNSNIFFQTYGNGCGLVKSCDKKDAVKEVYEPIEAVTGHPYIDVHPNTCAEQHKKPNK